MIADGVYADLSEAQRAELDRRFDHHPPADEVTAARHERWRADVKHLAAVAMRDLPDGREKSLALTALDDVLWCGTAAIARPVMPGRRPAAS